jgi:hypothetical protein
MRADPKGGMKGMRVAGVVLGVAMVMGVALLSLAGPVQAAARQRALIYWETNEYSDAVRRDGPEGLGPGQVVIAVFEHGEYSADLTEQAMGIGLSVEDLAQAPDEVAAKICDALGLPYETPERVAPDDAELPVKAEVFYEITGAPWIALGIVYSEPGQITPDSGVVAIIGVNNDI